MQTRTGEGTLLAVALAVHDAHTRLAAEVRDSSQEARYLVDEVSRRLELLVANIREREHALASLEDAIADRMNNLLMSIKTVADLVRAEQGETRVSEQLDAAVQSGRTSVRGLRDVCGDLR
jgi:sensor c-di-GMP phosphodiesterase-like protein